MKLNDNIGEWGSLAYWQSGEYQLIEERLHENKYNPAPGHLFAALRAVDLGACRVAIVGQDPYPRGDLCTGLAFSIPKTVGELNYPPTLVNIFKEYEDDLKYPAPKNGDLSKWCEQGVLLWNAFPSCAPGKPGSHHWEEWTYLTKEILEKLNVVQRPISGIFLGKVAASFVKYFDRQPSIITSHPSPLGVNRGFKGSKLFTRTNLSLEHLGAEPVDWRLS